MAHVFNPGLGEFHVSMVAMKPFSCNIWGKHFLSYLKLLNWEFFWRYNELEWGNWKWCLCYIDNDFVNVVYQGRKTGVKLVNFNSIWAVLWSRLSMCCSCRYLGSMADNDCFYPCL
jgi:hypothetical protein